MTKVNQLARRGPPCPPHASTPRSHLPRPAWTLIKRRLWLLRKSRALRCSPSHWPSKALGRCVIGWSLRARWLLRAYIRTTMLLLLALAGLSNTHVEKQPSIMQAACTAPAPTTRIAASTLTQHLHNHPQPPPPPTHSCAALQPRPDSLAPARPVQTSPQPTTSCRTSSNSSSRTSSSSSSRRPQTRFRSAAAAGPWPTPPTPRQRPQPASPTELATLPLPPRRASLPPLPPLSIAHACAVVVAPAAATAAAGPQQHPKTCAWRGLCLMRCWRPFPQQRTAPRARRPPSGSTWRPSGRVGWSAAACRRRHSEFLTTNAWGWSYPSFIYAFEWDHTILPTIRFSGDLLWIFWRGGCWQVDWSRSTLAPACCKSVHR